MKDIRYMVRVDCLTYNQVSYIEDAMNGFCMQETNFPFVCTILDDNSTDGEQEVIKNYLEAHFDLDNSYVVRNEETDDFYLTYARHKTNKNCYFAVLYLKYNHYSIRKPKKPYIEEWGDTKYVALCEGDDYWIDPLKLQKQVDFMESHPEHSLCFCAHITKDSEGREEIIRRYATDIECCPMEDIILGGGGYMATNSMLYRQSLYVSYLTWAIGCPIGDAPLTLSLAFMGKIGYLNEVMCAYRINAVGSWSQRMLSSFNLRWKHLKSITKMWHQFDEWSERKYSPIVKKKIRKNWSTFVKEEFAYLFLR
jgi:glycosyltransferase involved in cell wall biosynthesis